MASNEEIMEVEDSNGDSKGNKVKLRFRDPSKKVAQTKEMLSKQAIKIAKQAEEHERFINKVTHLLGVLGFGGFCFVLGAKGPLAWALIVWRCSLVFNSMDKIVSVFIHLLPGLVFFTIRWWDPVYFEAMHPGGRASWPYAESKAYLWTWLFFVPLAAYLVWQLLYFLIVNVLRRQRLVKDPEVMTSYRELSKKARKANNVWWRLSGLLGDQNRLFMYIMFQAIFTVATTALTVPIFLSYELHATFQLLKVSATVWNGGNFLLEVMPRQVILKEKKKTEKEQPAVEVQLNLSQEAPCN